VLLVVIGSDTKIFLATGSFGTCDDLVAGTHVEVRGSASEGRIDAREVRVR
jgi:hypothetical protein